MDRDNQQATLTEPEIAWLAAVIEGEGTLSLSIWKRDEKSGQNPKVGLQVKIYNHDAGLIKKAVELLKKLDVTHWIDEREQAPMARPGGGTYAPSAPMITVTVSRLEAVHRILTTLRPWFFGDKAPRADLMIAYLERRFEKIAAAGGNHRQVGYDAGDLAIVRSFYGLTNPNKAKLHPAVKRVLNELEQGTLATA